LTVAAGATGGRTPEGDGAREEVTVIGGDATESEVKDACATGAGATRGDATGAGAAAAAPRGDETDADEIGTEAAALELFVSSVAPMATDVPAVATATVLGVTADRSARMLPSHAIRLARANPKTKEITREVESLSRVTSFLAGQAGDGAACSS
jgi:hypothetical protein